MAMEDNFAYRQAYELVKAGLESGVIKLKGVDNTDFATRNGKSDAEYLIAMIQDLATALPK